MLGFKKPTVFVLGAGAAYPFGMPLGNRLRELVTEYLCNPDGGPHPRGDILQAERWQKLQERRAAFGRELSQHGGTVDRMLQDQAVAGHKDRCYLDVMREMVHVLEDAQMNALLRVSDETNDRGERLLCLSRHWHREFFEWIYDDQKQELVPGDLRVITFNYDLLFECAMASMLRARKVIPFQTAREIVESSLSITHIYGNLDGKISMEEATSLLKYDPDRAASVSNIQIAIPDRTDNKQLSKARRWIQEAKQIVFLGFGFDPINCMNLALNQDSLASKTSYYTCVGMDNALRARVGAMCRSSFTMDVAWDCEVLLKNLGSVLLK